MQPINITEVLIKFEGLQAIQYVLKGHQEVVPKVLEAKSRQAFKVGQRPLESILITFKTIYTEHEQIDGDKAYELF